MARGLPYATTPAALSAPSIAYGSHEHNCWWKPLRFAVPAGGRGGATLSVACSECFGAVGPAPGQETAQRKKGRTKIRGARCAISLRRNFSQGDRLSGPL